MVRSDRPARFYPEVVRVSLWLVVGLWLARRLARLIVLIVRSPTAVTVIVLAAAGTAGWRLVSPALPLGVVAGLVAVLVVWRLPLAGLVREARLLPGSGLAARRLGVSAAVDHRDGHRRVDQGPTRHHLRAAAASSAVDPHGGSGAAADAGRPNDRGLRQRRGPAGPNLRRSRLPGPLDPAGVGTTSSCGC